MLYTDVTEVFVKQLSTEVFIKDVPHVTRLLNHFRTGSAESLQVVSDFHHTISGYVNKDRQRIRSTFGISQESSELSLATIQKIQQLYDDYIIPLYYNTEISLDDKATALAKVQNEWILAMGKDTKFTRQVVSGFCDKITLREQADEFFGFFQQNSIPLTIVSAGIGDVVEDLLEKRGLLHDNVHLISNKFLWDTKQGNCIGIPLECVNPVPNSASIKKHLSKNQSRKNIILMGDNTSDICMTQNLALESYQTLNIGFLNLPKNEWLRAYKETFDIVIADDHTLQVPLKILQKIIEE